MLQLADMQTFYGASQVLFDVSLDLRPGECLALLGRNGMGKTTTIRSIMGLTPPAAGRVVFRGQSLVGLKPFQIARTGIGLVPEGRRLFANLTVAQNMSATMRDGIDIAGGQSGQWTVARIHKLFPRLEERRDQLAGTLSGGEQQMLAIARALLTNPKLLLLDEATEGLAPLIRREIRYIIAELKSEGLSILIVDKNINELAEIAVRGAIIEKGRTVWHGALLDLLDDENLRQRYLGV